MMDFIDLKKQQEFIKEDLEANIKTVLEHGKFIMGPEVKELENVLANYVGTKFCIGVSSGTDALLIALMALDVKEGDEVITTPFSFIATAETILLLGAKPVFVDIDPKTYNIDPAKIEDKITPKTKAIMPVSLYGQCADFDEINKIAQKYDLKVIEDGAQSFGATFKGKKSCSLSDIGCTSFFPSKPLGSYGDSGACFTNSEDLFDRMNSIRLHGQEKRYHHVRIGINGRIDTIQAAILLAKMKVFPKEVSLRAEVGNEYTKLFKKNGSKIQTPHIIEDTTSVFAQYTIEVSDRQKILDGLKDKGIPTAVHYPVPLHKQPIMDYMNLSCPISERASLRVMSLPMHPYLSEEDQAYVVKNITKLVRD